MPTYWKTETYPSFKNKRKMEKQTLQMTQHMSTQKYTKATVHLPPPTCPPAVCPLPSSQMPKPGPRYHSELFLFPKSPPSILAKSHWLQLSPRSITLLDAFPWVVNPPLPTQGQPPVTLLSSTLPHTPLHTTALSLCTLSSFILKSLIVGWGRILRVDIHFYGWHVL